MEFTVKAGTLAKELDLGQRIVSRKTSIPILTHVLAETDADGVTLTFTDTEAGLRTTCGAGVTRQGKAALPAKKLQEIVKALPTDGELKVSHDGKSAALSCGAYKGRLQCLPTDDFPALAEPSGTSATLPGAALKDLLARAASSCGQGDERYFLDGALLVLAAGSVTVVSSDGHRLSRATVGFDGVPSMAQAILPRAAMEDLAAILGGDANDVEYTLGENHLFFQVGPRLLLSRQVAGQYPKWERVVPKGHPFHAEFDRASMEGALKRVAIMAEATSSRTTKMVFGPGSIEVSAVSAQFGDADEQVAADYKGDPVTLHINSQYVLDFLGTCGTPRVTADVKDARSAVIWSPAGGDVDALCVIMTVMA